MRKAAFSKDLIPLRPVQSDNPFTRKPKTKKRLTWRRRDSSQSMITDLNILQKKLENEQSEED